MRKKYLIIGAIITGVLLVLLLLANATQNGTLEISAPETPNNATVEVTITFEQGSTQTFTVAPKSTRTISTRTGTHRVDSKVGDVKAMDIVKIQASQTAKLTLRFATQMVVQKIGTDAEYCPWIVENTVYSYNCQGDGFIYRHPSADGRKIPIMSSQYFGTIKPYNTGFIGFPISQPGNTDHSDLRFSFIDMKTQTMRDIPLPSGVVAKGLSTNASIIVPSDPSKTFFALAVYSQSKVYLYKNATDQTPTAITLPSDKKFDGDTTVASFSYDNETLVTYIGNIVNGEEHDGEEVDDSAPVATNPENLKSDGKIFEYDQQGKLTKTIAVPDDFWADEIARLAENYYAAVNIRGTAVYYLRDGRLEPIYNISDGVSSLTAKNQLYMIVNNGIFVFTPQENGLFSLQNAFNNSEIRASNLFDSPGPVLFTGFQEGQEPLNIYSLTKP